jgi:hypothetical protein
MRAVGAFLLHSVIGSVTCLAGNFLGAWLQPHAGLFSPIRQFASVCLLTAVVGYCASAWNESRAAFWIWIPPSLLLALSLFTDPTPLNQYFGPDCSDSECLYLILFMAPFLGAITYSLASLVRARVRKATGTG